MSERRRKVKAKVQPAPPNIQPAAAEEKSDKSRELRNARSDKTSDYLLDLSKYIFTGVIITSLFNDISDEIWLYSLSFPLVITLYAFGMLLTRKN